MNRPYLLKIIGLLCIALAFGISPSHAQQNIKPVTVDPLREALAGRSPFPSTLDTKPLQSLHDRLTSQTKSRCPVDAIITLKNPFQSALPVPEAPVEEIKTPPVKTEPMPLLPPPVSDKGGEPIPIPKPNFRVQGIVWDTDIPQAIVNNEVLSIGDKLSGWTVIEINTQGVKMGIDTKNIYWFSP